MSGPTVSRNRLRHPTRREVLTISAAGAGVTALGLTAAAVWSSGADPIDTNSAAARLKSDHMQIIAHPDDDLFFNNLDIYNGLQQNVSQLTVCLTCGEADGFNGTQARQSQKPEFETYTAARYEGLRAAYAHMVTGKHDAPWIRTPLRFPTGHVAELATLEGHDTVALVFLNMWVNATITDPTREYGRLYHLWQERSQNQPTMAVPGSPVTDVFNYTRADVLDTILHLYQVAQPKVIRTMDLDPDPQVHNDDTPQYADQTGYSDSYDHTPTALFTWQSYLNWRNRAGGQQSIITSYRGYYNRRWPSNLSEKAVDIKAPAIDIYGWNDHRVCSVEYGCGDLNVPGIKASGGYGLSTILRYPERYDWALLADDGCIRAVSSIGSRLHMWTEKAPGSGEWGKPIPLHNEYLLPEITISTTAEGSWSVQGIRPRFSPGNANHVREIVHADIPQHASMLYWEVLGNPTRNDADPVERRNVGQPIQHSTDDTRYMFARNHSRSISFRRHNGKDWDGWKDLDGPRIQDGLATINGANGSVHIFAAGNKGIVHWTYNGQWNHHLLDGFTPAAAPSVTTLVDGRILVISREAETAEVSGYLLDKNAQNILTTLTLGAKTGTGSVALLPWKNDTVGVTMAIRTDTGRIATTEWAIGEPAPEWNEGDSPICVGLPALVFNNDNHATALAVTLQTELYTANQGPDGTGPITGWKPAVTA